MRTVASKHDASKRIASKRIARIGLVLGVFLAVLVGVLVLQLGAGTTGCAGPGCDGARTTGAGTGGAVLAVSSGSFTIEGDAAGPISPGVTAPLDLLLTNPHNVPMSITAFTVTVQKVSAPHADDAHPCVVGDFTVNQASRSLEITLPARATSALSGLGLARASLPAVGMLDRSVNQDGCKGASLTLGYAASGTVSQ